MGEQVLDVESHQDVLEDEDDEFELDLGQTTGDGQQFITFCLADEDYGVEITKVQEIISYRKLTKLPNVPDFIKGVLNLRGTVVPVIDLRTNNELARLLQVIASFDQVAAHLLDQL